jgi:hypothetical protein
VVLSEAAEGGLDVLPDHVEVGRVHGYLSLVPDQAIQPLHLVRHHVRALRLLKRVAAQNARPHLRKVCKGMISRESILGA